MTAVAGFALYSVFFGVFASLAAVLLDLHLSGYRAIAKSVRAFNSLLHTGDLPATAN
jgi:hypothetical protein